MKEIICNGEINISDLLKVNAMLDNAIAVASSSLEKTGAIKYFEYSYELSWKTMVRILKLKKIEARNPKDAFREAAKAKLISNFDTWSSFIAKRNKTSDAYNSELAEEIFNFLPEFQAEAALFMKNIQKL